MKNEHSWTVYSWYELLEKWRPASIRYFEVGEATRMLMSYRMYSGTENFANHYILVRNDDEDFTFPGDPSEEPRKKAGPDLRMV